MEVTIVDEVAALFEDEEVYTLRDTLMPVVIEFVKSGHVGENNTFTLSTLMTIAALSTKNRNTFYRRLISNIEAKYIYRHNPGDNNQQSEIFFTPAGFWMGFGKFPRNNVCKVVVGLQAKVFHIAMENMGRNLIHQTEQLAIKDRTIEVNNHAIQELNSRANRRLHKFAKEVLGNRYNHDAVRKICSMNRQLVEWIDSVPFVKLGCVQRMTNKLLGVAPGQGTLAGYFQ